jgi:hypothetical protein
MMTCESRTLPCLGCGLSPLGTRSHLRLCQKCYKRLKYAGQLPVADFAYVTQHFRRITDEGCWEWLGALNPDGYGKFRQKMVHRLSYEAAGGVIPPGFHIDHLCRNTRCFNPDHLEAVTPLENTLRGVGPTSIAARRQHCQAGHDYTPENTYVIPKTGHRRCKTCARAYVARAASRAAEAS